jgi:hypothetical protein
MTRTSLTINIVAILFVAIAGLFQVYVRPVLSVWGVWRVVQSIGTSDCIGVPELKACESVYGWTMSKSIAHCFPGQKS